LNSDIVEKFCTPPRMPETEADTKTLKDASVGEVFFEGMALKTYSWGEGPAILIVHGWGSRASHMIFIARTLADSGYHVTAFDAPAHGNSLKKNGSNTSNFFEFARSIKCAADQIAPLYAIIGHSMGALAAAFTTAGAERLAAYRTPAEKLVLISPPAGAARLVEHFCRVNSCAERTRELSSGLEREFDFSLSGLELAAVVNQIKAGLLVIHDEDDTDIPVSDSIRLKEFRSDMTLLMTRGAGHKRILFNRDMIRGIKGFLEKPVRKLTGEK
jgi:pimeloyl-ACP methyl ester carboxylesterase